MTYFCFYGNRQRLIHPEAEDRPVFAGAFTRLYGTAQADAAESASLTAPHGPERKSGASGRPGEATEEDPISTGEHP